MQHRISLAKILKKKQILFLCLVIACLATTAQRSITVTNDAKPSSKKGYYDWVVYISGHADTLKKINQVVYTLHPSFKNPVQTVTYKQSNVFRYCTSGWGEFAIKVKIIFNDKKRKPLEMKYQLNFRNKRTKYLCK